MDLKPYNIKSYSHTVSPYVTEEKDTEVSEVLTSAFLSIDKIDVRNTNGPNT